MTTPFYLIPLKSGISVHVGELPEEPNHLNYKYQNDLKEWLWRTTSHLHQYGEDYDQYQKKLQSCQDNAVLCADQDQAKKIIISHAFVYREENIQPDKFYGPFSGVVELKEVLSDGWVPTYHDPSNSGGHPNAEPITVAFITLTNNKVVEEIDPVFEVGRNKDDGNKVSDTLEERIEDLTLLLEAAKSGCDQRDRIIEDLRNGNSKITREKIAEIIKDNITFSHQIDAYIIHGAIEKIMDLVGVEQEKESELSEMISKVHEDIEGRYNLDSYDKGVIHSLLCKLQK